jgi:hypothetical protein
MPTRPRMQAAIPTTVQPTADPGRLWARTQRLVSVGVPEVRAALLRVLRDLDFEIDSEQFSGVRASRGSQLGGATLSPARVPTSLQIGFEPVGSATGVSVYLEDRWRSPVGRQNAAAAAYQRVFNDVIGALDAALARLDPAAGAGFAPREEYVGSAEASGAVVDRFGRLEATFKRKTSRLLDGKAAPGAGQLGRGNASSFEATEVQVAICSPDRVARMDLPAAYTMLTAGQLIAARPGKLPPKMAEQVQGLVIVLEQRLDTSAPTPSFVQLQITAEQVPVVTFLRQQARLRDQLPLRTLQVCDTCRLEKVINPDFIQMRERSRRMKVLTGSFGAVITGRHVSPYVLVGKLVQLKKSDPDFVCQRCQGLDADETIITFCPQCGDRRTEAALRECPKCHLDYRTLLAPEAIWQEIAEGPAELPAIAPMALPAGSQPSIPPDWYPDYSGRHEHRYWDGTAWTSHVSDAGVATMDEPV